MSRLNVISSVRWANGWLSLWLGIIAAMALGTPATAFCDGSARSRVIVDFKNIQSDALRPMQAKAKIVRIDGRRALEITTEATASWPGVLIQPRNGKWDLSGFDSLEMEVQNPQDVPVRVLLSVNNPGADGRHRCNTASVNVPRRGKATLVLPFGTWHGEPGHPLDLKNVVSVQVLLDRAGRSHRFIVGDIRATSFDDERLKAAVEGPFLRHRKPVYGRGVNLANALEAPKEGDWGVVLKEEYFEKIKTAGFESVRIPIRWSSHAEESAPYRIDPKFFDRIDWAADQALKRRLVAILDMHHFDGIFEEPEKHEARFLALWQQIAEHYKDYPPALSFELLNEPHQNLTAEKWNRLLAKTLAVVRRTNPKRLVVIGPAAWNGISELANLELPEEDRNLVVTVHYYNPFHFTHQGASWVGPDSQSWLGTKWTGTKAEQQAIVRDLAPATIWAANHRRPLYLGEFGAYDKADLESRARWTGFVADEAIRQKMDFGYWEFCNGFGVYDPQKNQWIAPLREALLPSGR
jgi:aryl-phospho-beta-D-glucosidase BglC (GH1 family)